jgi:hypothetical protein
MNARWFYAICGLVILGSVGNIYEHYYPTPAKPPAPVSAADQAKIAQYRAEEKKYWAVHTHCGPQASGFLCDKNLNELAKLEVKHARWTKSDAI